MKIYEKSLNEMKKSLLAIPNKPLILKSKNGQRDYSKRCSNGDQAVRDYEHKFDNVNLADFQFPPFSLIRRWMRSMMTCGQLWNWLSKTLPAFTNKKSKTALLTSARQASCAGKRLRHWPAWGCMYQAERQPILQLF